MNSKKNSTSNNKLTIKLDDFKTSASVFYIITIIILTLTPPILGIIWLERLKKISCQCSDISWYKKYINFYFIFIIIYTIIIILFNIFIINKLNNFETFKARLLLGIFMYIYNLVSYFIIIYYIYKLKEIKCKCSRLINREIIYIWYIVLFIFASLTLPVFLYGSYLLLQSI